MGWIRGSEWNFVAGRAYRSSYGFTEHLIVELWNQRVSDPCRKEAGSEWAVTLKTVAQVGEWALGSDPFRASPMIFFTGPTENWMAFQGFIGIDLIAETEVRGRFMASFPAESLERTEASGAFSIIYCDEIYP